MRPCRSACRSARPDAAPTGSDEIDAHRPIDVVGALGDRGARGRTERPLRAIATPAHGRAGGGRVADLVNRVSFRAWLASALERFGVHRAHVGLPLDGMLRAAPARGSSAASSRPGTR